MTLTTHVHLSFDGRCEAAFEFYERRLGAKVEGMFKYEGSPMAGEVPPGWEAKVMHASIRIGGLLVMGSDVPPERYERPAGFQVMLATADAAGARRERRRLKVSGLFSPDAGATCPSQRCKVFFSPDAGATSATPDGRK